MVCTKYGALGVTNVFLNCEIVTWRGRMSDAIVTFSCVMITLLARVQLPHNAKLFSGHRHVSNLRVPRVNYALSVKHALC